MAFKGKTDALAQAEREGFDSADATALEQLRLAYMSEIVTGPALDPEAATVAIASRILTAESEDDVLGEGAGALSAEDLNGASFLLRDAVFRKGSYGDYSVFVVLTVRMASTHKEEVITCGGENVLAQVKRLKDLGKIPSDTLMRFETKQTAGGFPVLWLRKG